MKVSTRGRYALRAMVILAKNYGKGPITIRTISEEQGISLKYLETIMRSFAVNGMVISAKGKNGGFILATAPSSVRISDIIKATESTLAPVDCIEYPNKCDKVVDCETRRLWHGLNKVVEEYLNSITLEDVANKNIDLLMNK